MKLITKSHKYNTQSLQKFLHSDGFKQSLLSFCAFTLFALIIWFGGPSLTWHDTAPLASTEKRLYIILFFFLVWLLKFLMIDLESKNKIPLPNDPELKKTLQGLQNRFRGAMEFLKKTIPAKNGKSVRLQQLPWCLLIGPSHSGKTSLLANSTIHFILQRQFPAKTTQNLDPSEHCDWWITQESSIVDVPSRYLHTQKIAKNEREFLHVPIIWNYFLNLVRKNNKSIDSIAIALPLPEIMLQGDPKKYQTVLQNLFQRLKDVQKKFPQPIPCFLVITKCDLLPGFDEFFAESSQEEVVQAWGITLAADKGKEKNYDLLAQQFNALIKKLNQQLLWRLHQERNPMARPYIKDFPLQVERLKEFILDFIKKFYANQVTLSLRGIYLTSALQDRTEPEDNIIEDVNFSNEKAVQLFKEPKNASRAYFVKQFLNHGLTIKDYSRVRIIDNVWTRRFALALSVLAIGGTIFFLGRDFQLGFLQSQTLEKNLADYQNATVQFQDPHEHLVQTVEFLNTLRDTSRKIKMKENLAYLLSFYSQKSQQRVSAAYGRALHNILVPEVTNYLAEHLKNPVNRNTDALYATLKTYLMLGDPRQVQHDFMRQTLRQLLASGLSNEKINQLLDHLHVAFKRDYVPQVLDNDLISQTRKYLTSLPGFQLGFVILKNFNNNNINTQLDLGVNNSHHPALVSEQVANNVPIMFTGKAFAAIIADESAIAAHEASDGNSVLGSDFGGIHSDEITTNLIQQIRSSYVTSYIALWENMLANIHLNPTNNLKETDDLILNLVSTHSPLLQLMQTVYDNTYFEPIISSSQKLYNLGLLVDKNNSASQDLLYQVFASLNAVHQSIETVISAKNEKKAAFQAISHYMIHRDQIDPMTQLRLVAEKTPDPVKTWLMKIANDTSRTLLEDAMHYIDISWQEEVGKVYLRDIANRYPFTPSSNREVSLPSFIKFFGKSGAVLSFYNDYLQPFVDTSHAEWRWKTFSDNKLPFSDESLRQLQQAMRIYESFFPSKDNKVNVQFSLQPYQFAKTIKSVKLNINDKQIVDTKAAPRITHTISWPSNYTIRNTNFQLLVNNQKPINRAYVGDWGWFKLVNQAFESASSHKQLVLNFSSQRAAAKYLLATNGEFNPFLSLNMNHFQLPVSLLENNS